MPVFNYQADAQTAAEQLQRGWKFHQVVAEVIPITHYAKHRRPAAEDQPETVGYGLKGSLSTDPAKLEVAEFNFGKFIIATKQLDEDQLSAEQMLSNYTDQAVSVERPFRFP